jgi:hypothetical protein
VSRQMEKTQLWSWRNAGTGETKNQKYWPRDHGEGINDWDGMSLKEPHDSISSLSVFTQVMTKGFQNCRTHYRGFNEQIQLNFAEQSNLILSNVEIYLNTLKWKAISVTEHNNKQKTKLTVADDLTP